MRASAADAARPLPRPAAPRPGATSPTAFREVGDGHARRGRRAATSASGSPRSATRHAERLAPFAERYGEDAPTTSPTGLHSRALPRAARRAALGLLRDLHDLYLMAAECDIAWTLVGQAAQGAARRRAARGRRRRARRRPRCSSSGSRTRMKQAAPQALVVRMSAATRATRADRPASDREPAAARLPRPRRPAPCWSAASSSAGSQPATGPRRRADPARVRRSRCSSWRRSSATSAATSSPAPAWASSPGTWLSIGLVTLTAPPGVDERRARPLPAARGHRDAGPRRRGRAPASSSRRGGPRHHRAALRRAPASTSSPACGDVEGRRRRRSASCCCALALYAALALALEDARGATVLPIGRIGGGAAALEGGVDEQTAGLQHAAGVRRQL